MRQVPQKEPLVWLRPSRRENAALGAFMLICFVAALAITLAVHGRLNHKLSDWLIGVIAGSVGAWVSRRRIAARVAPVRISPGALQEGFGWTWISALKACSLLLVLVIVSAVWRWVAFFAGGGALVGSLLAVFDLRQVVAFERSRQAKLLRRIRAPGRVDYQRRVLVFRPRDESESMSRD